MASYFIESDSELPELNDAFTEYLRIGDARSFKLQESSEVSEQATAHKNTWKTSAQDEQICAENVRPKGTVAKQVKKQEHRRPLQAVSQNPSQPKLGMPRRVAAAHVDYSSAEDAPSPPARLQRDLKPKKEESDQGSSSQCADSDTSFDSLDGFIVRDSSYVESSVAASSDEEEGEEDVIVPPSVVELPAKRATRRRLVRRVAVSKDAEIDSDSDERGTSRPSCLEPDFKSETPPAQLEESAQESFLDSMQSLTLITKSSPAVTPPRNTLKPSRPATPPAPILPSSKLASPKKNKTIPALPLRQSSDGFWNPVVVNDWNEQHSPRKLPLPPKTPARNTPAPSKKPGSFVPGSSLRQSPLRNSPQKKDRVALDRKAEFDQRKLIRAVSFLKEVDQTVTGGQIAKLTTVTGGVKIVWSKKLNSTAGRAVWRRVLEKPSSELGLKKYQHVASIELSEKVIDCEDRLLNTIAHEYCHLANFMISNIRTNPHGKEFKAWAQKCTQAFSHLQVEVTTKHAYEIDYKYIWACTAEACGLEYKRHSKSIDTARHKCGVCRASLAQIRPAPTARAGKGVSGYQAFVKEHFATVRKEVPPGTPHGDVMREVGRRFREGKRGGEKDGVPVLDEGEDLGCDGSLDGDMGEVVRVLDFLKLGAGAE
ncbi:MAG: hypothetical protein M1829_004814 [Trizodia sp. TS-e1964]|nr:MAG: hypothetical protein M1829_004814 [Trizodia sp. TS-e1964]